MYEGGEGLGIGLVISMGLALFATQRQTNSLHGITPEDPVTCAGTPATPGFAGIAACLIPALRVLRMNPVEALRNE